MPWVKNKIASEESIQKKLFLQQFNVGTQTSLIKFQEASQLPTSELSEAIFIYTSSFNVVWSQQLVLAVQGRLQPETRGML